MSFVIANMYLLNFYNSTLNADKNATEFLAKRPAISGVTPGIWDIAAVEPVKYGPTFTEFENIVRTQGIKQAIDIVRPTLSTDSTSGIWSAHAMNRLGYAFMQEKKLDEAVAIFTLNSEMHPDDPNWMDSVAEAYEAKGDSVNMKKYAQIVLDILAKKEKLSEFDIGLKGNSERRLKK
jgi:hypothetical protein